MGGKNSLFWQGGLFRGRGKGGEGASCFHAEGNFGLTAWTDLQDLPILHPDSSGQLEAYLGPEGGGRLQYCCTSILLL